MAWLLLETFRQVDSKNLEQREEQKDSKNCSLTRHGSFVLLPFTESVSPTCVLGKCEVHEVQLSSSQMKTRLAYFFICHTDLEFKV